MISPGDIRKRRVPKSRARTIVSETGWHPLTLALVAIQICILAGTLPAYSWLGLNVDWSSATSLMIVAGGAFVAWAYYVSTPTTPFERGLAETALVFGLLLVLGITIPPAQYAAAALNRPLIDPLLGAADAAIGVDVRALTAVDACTSDHQPMADLCVYSACCGSSS